MTPNMSDEGAHSRGDPSAGRNFRDSVSDTMRITDLAAPRKIPPGSGWRKFIYNVSFRKINLGESPRERHYRDLQDRIRRHIRRQYVITVVSGKGGVGVTTIAACIGGVFRECRPQNVIAIDAVPGFGTLADRIDESPPGTTPPSSTTPTSRATRTSASTWGKTRSGSTCWPEIGRQTSPGRWSRQCFPGSCHDCGEPTPSWSSTPRPTSSTT